MIKFEKVYIIYKFDKFHSIHLDQEIGSNILLREIPFINWQEMFESSFLDPISIGEMKGTIDSSQLK